ncbi:MAG: adenylate cyclase regulatory domain-containing protein [Candidatus Binatia bacterium]
MNPTDYQAAGLYDPTSPNAAERLELLEWLTGRNITIRQMQQANARGQLPFVASTAIMRPGPYLTQQQLADRLGITNEFLETFRVAFALPPVAPDAPWCNEAEAEMFGAVAAGVGLFGPQGMLRLSRVLGSSVSRIAEAMATTNAERMRAIVDTGATELQLAQANVAAVATAGAPARIITGLLSIHLQLAAARVRERRAKLADETMNGCVGFVDLVGSTTLSRRLSARELADFVERFEEVAHRIATNGRGRVVKFIGDEVMFVTGDAASGCKIALSLIEAFVGDPSVTPRAGLAAGALLDRGGDYYGPIVNLAARLAELAVPSEVLVSMEVADHLAGSGLECEPAGRRLLRGFDEPVSLMSVRRA